MFLDFFHVLSISIFFKADNPDCGDLAKARNAIQKLGWKFKEVPFEPNEIPKELQGSVAFTGRSPVVQVTYVYNDDKSKTIVVQAQEVSPEALRELIPLRDLWKEQ